MFNEYAIANVLRREIEAYRRSDSPAAAASKGISPARRAARRLELLLEVEWFSPKYTYPAHVEILLDVVLTLLGRTTAPAPTRPACDAPGWRIRPRRGEALLVSSEDGEELHVPLESATGICRIPEATLPHQV
jgi:hypothetical protein